MIRLALAAALLVGCRGDAPKPAGGSGGVGSAASAARPALVPKLPASPAAADELRSLDAAIARGGDDPALTVAPRLDRAAIVGDLDDYVTALAGSERWLAAYPKDVPAWQTRVRALSRVHQFAAARAALAQLKALARDPSEWDGLAATLDEATGDLAAAGAYRERIAHDFPSPTSLTLLAAHLAVVGRYDEALALMPRAAKLVRDNAAGLVSWIYFQWGRIYEQRGELATARDFFAAAHARMPTLEATVHLAQAMRATGGDPAAILADAVAANPHPELLALAGKTEEARREWDRYLAALPEAFSDHAARFFLGPGADPARALALARANLANRDTWEARALAVEAALAAKDPTAACEAAPPLAAAAVPRLQRFFAWRAFAACGRRAEADQLAQALGIH